MNIQVESPTPHEMTLAEYEAHCAQVLEDERTAMKQSYPDLERRVTLPVLLVDPMPVGLSSKDGAPYWTIYRKYLGEARALWRLARE